MPNAPAFQKINIPETQALALEFDRSGYDASDLDFLRRFPLLAEGREFNIEDSANQMAGAQDPLVAQTLDKAGLSADYGATPYAQSRNMGAQEIVSKEKRDRNYFSRLLAENPSRQFGLGGQDIARVSIANTMGQNNYNQGMFGSRINAYNAQIQQNAQTNAGYANAAGDLFGSIAKYYRNSQPNSLSASYYGPSAMGYGASNANSYGGFNFGSTAGGYR